MSILIITFTLFLLSCSRPPCNSIHVQVTNPSAIDYDIAVRHNGGQCGSAAWSAYEFHQLENTTYTVYILHKSPREMIAKQEVTFDQRHCQTETVRFHLQ